METRSTFLDETEVDIGIGQRVASDQIGDPASLGVLRLEELATGRDVVEQIVHTHDGPAGGPDRLHRSDLPRFDNDTRPDLFAGGPRYELQPAYSPDRGQGLAAEAEACDRHQVVDGLQLGGRIASNRQRDFLRRDSRTVIGHLDKAATALFDANLDGPSTGVERVLDQLLDDRGRPLDDLTRSDRRRDALGENAYQHLHLQRPRNPSESRPSGSVR